MTSLRRSAQGNGKTLRCNIFAVGILLQQNKQTHKHIQANKKDKHLSRSDIYQGQKELDIFKIFEILIEYFSIE